MIKAALRRLHSPDVWDLGSHAPDDPDRFSILVQAMIGPEGGPGEESFDFVICTPALLAKDLETRRYQFGRHYLFVNRYDPELIEQVLHELCESASGPDWESVATYLSRYGQWEFEDYTDVES